MGDLDGISGFSLGKIQLLHSFGEWPSEWKTSPIFLGSFSLLFLFSFSSFSFSPLLSLLFPSLLLLLSLPFSKLWLYKIFLCNSSLILLFKDILFYLSQQQMTNRFFSIFFRITTQLWVKRWSLYATIHPNNLENLTKCMLLMPSFYTVILAMSS